MHSLNHSFKVSFEMFLPFGFHGQMLKWGQRGAEEFHHMQGLNFFVNALIVLVVHLKDAVHLLEDGVRFFVEVGQH